MTRSDPWAYIAYGVLLGSVTIHAHVFAADPGQQTDVPMTRADEAIAILADIGENATFLTLPDGRILHTSGAGKFSASDDGGLSWPEQWQATDPDGLPLGMGECGLVSLSDGAIGVATRYEEGMQSGGEEFIAFFRSEDQGKTWSRPIRVTPPGVEHAQLNDAVLRTSSGRIVVPTYACIGMAKNPRAEVRRLGAYIDGQWIPVGAHDYDPKFCWCAVSYSDDDGRTWQQSRGGQIFIWDEANMTWNRTSEPSVAEVEPEHLLMVMRTELGRLYQSHSYDNGETWTAPEPTLLAASSSPAQIRQIPGTGDLLMVWSQASELEIRQGLIRSRLSTAISRSKGAVWEFYQNIDSALEGTRIEPGPLRRVRPEGIFWGGARPQEVRDPETIVELPKDYRLTSYPSVRFHEDRLLVGHTNAHFKEDGEYVMPGKLIIVPKPWLYGGEERMKRNGFYEMLQERFPE